MSIRQKYSTFKKAIWFSSSRTVVVPLRFPPLVLALPPVSDANAAETVATLSQTYGDMRRPQRGGTGLIKLVCDSTALGRTGRENAGSLSASAVSPLFPHDFSLDIPHKLLFVRYNKF